MKNNKEILNWFSEGGRDDWGYVREVRNPVVIINQSFFSDLTNGDYFIAINMPHAGKILSTSTWCTWGTEEGRTGKFKINNTEIGGLANTLSTTKQTVDHSSDSSVEFAKGDSLMISITGASSLTGLVVSLNVEKYIEQ